MPCFFERLDFFGCCRLVFQSCFHRCFPLKLSLADMRLDIGEQVRNRDAVLMHGVPVAHRDGVY